MIALPIHNIEMYDIFNQILRPTNQDLLVNKSGRNRYKQEKGQDFFLCMQCKSLPFYLGVPKSMPKK